MSCQIPYLLRRGDTFVFRIVVPTDLRPVFGVREVVRSLRTSDRRIAASRALRYASKMLYLFSELRAMPNGHKENMQFDYTLIVDFDELGLPKQFKVEGEPHEQVAINSAIKTVIETGQARSCSTNGPSKKDDSQAQQSVSIPTFKIVVDAFLESYRKDKKPAMFKKHRPVLTMFLEVIGNKPVNDIKQADINEFFSLLNKLPPRWQDECRKRKLSVKDLAKLDHAETLGPKSFDDTYKASVRSFLKVAKKDWQDQGFPTTLTTDGIEYQGDREEGEKKQREFRLAELERLFYGPEMQSFAADPTLEHCFWLPHLGLFTGARVNELCQLNPQTDILIDVETGIYHLLITEETEGDARIEKSTKNVISRRKVPIHTKLVELGFQIYVERVKKTGGKLLFPAWKPSRGKASGAAEKWFRQLLCDIGLRDETLGARIVGMHAFRNTLLNRASNANPQIDATSITGHANDVSKVVRGYQGELSLTNKKRILEEIPFGIDFKYSISTVA